jgi:hypothetical protein
LTRDAGEALAPRVERQELSARRIVYDQIGFFHDTFTCLVAFFEA